MADKSVILNQEKPSQVSIDDETSHASSDEGLQLVSFGKHGTLTFHALATTQLGYTQWLFKQGWFQSRYPNLYEYLSKCGLCSSPIEGDINILDHNAFQAVFADDAELLRLVQSILGEEYTYNITNVIFEHICNADIVIEVERKPANAGYFTNSIYFVLVLELKPTVSNDYPEVLRQMHVQRRAYMFYNPVTKRNPIVKQALVMQAYTGNVKLETVRKIYGDILIIENSYAEPIEADS